MESELLAGIRDHLLTPEAIEAGVRAYQAEARATQLTALKRRSGWEKELADIEGKIDRTLDLYEREVIDVKSVQKRMTGLETRRDELSGLLAQAEEPSALTIHPNAAEHYRAIIERLGEALQGEEAAEALHALRGLVERITFYPGEAKGAYSLEIYGRLGGLMEKKPLKSSLTATGASHVEMGAGTRNHRDRHSLSIAV